MLWETQGCCCTCAPEGHAKGRWGTKRADERLKSEHKTQERQSGRPMTQARRNRAQEPGHGVTEVGEVLVLTTPQTIRVNSTPTSPQPSHILLAVPPYVWEPAH